MQRNCWKQWQRFCSYVLIKHFQPKRPGPGNIMPENGLTSWRYSKKAHWRWKQAGKPRDPRNGPLIPCKWTKKQLRRQQRREQLNSEHRNTAKLWKLTPLTGNSSISSSANRWVIPVVNILISSLMIGICRTLKTSALDGQHTSENSVSQTPRAISTQATNNRLMATYSTLLDSARRHSSEKIQTVNSLRHGKAADGDGITAERLKYAGSSLLHILSTLFAKIQDMNTTPEAFKSGIITPIYKKQGKPLNDPNSYRRITISNSIGKVFETLQLNRNTKVIENYLNKL